MTVVALRRTKKPRDLNLSEAKPMARPQIADQMNGGAD